MKIQWQGLLIALFSFVLIAPLVSWANTQGQASLSEASFVSPDYVQTQRTSFQFVGVGVNTLSQARSEREIENGLQGHVYGAVAPGVGILNYLNFSQLYWKQESLFVGRKKMQWSLLDEDYVLGLYQPLFKWNILQPEAQGLSGLFLHLESEPKADLPWGITVFGSTVFIPDQGAGYEISDGEFQKSNPYFQTPPTQAQINGQTDQVVYTLQKPDTQDVVFNRSWASQAYLGKENQGGFLSVAYANKPSNQLALGFQGAVTPQERVDVQILPAVYYHTLLSADLKYSFRGLGFGLSGIHETSEDPQYDSAWTYVKYAPATLVSPFIEFHFLRSTLKFSRLTVQGGEETNVGPLADQSTGFLPSRYPFRNAYQVAFQTDFRLRRFQKISFSTRYLSGEKSEFALWTTQGAYQWSERWSAFVQSQMVVVENSSDGRRVAYNAYQNNDTVALGVNYVF